MKITIFYPSGNSLTVKGIWKGPGRIIDNNVILIEIDEDVEIMGYTLEKGEALIGDPRGVYRNDDTGKILYNPRDAMIGMQKVWIDWLNEHPEWPDILELNAADL